MNQAAGAALLGSAVVLGILRWKPFRVEVSGESMVPTLRPGEWAIGLRERRIRRGDLVVVEHPWRQGFELVKRVGGLPGERVGGRLLADGEYWVEGDAPDASTDSRHFGPIVRDRIRGRLRLVYWPPDRRRVLRRG